MELKTFHATDAQGNPVDTATVALYLDGTPALAGALQDENGLALPNPFVSADHIIRFAAPNGSYDLNVSSNGRTKTQRATFLDPLESGTLEITAFDTADSRSLATWAAAIRQREQFVESVAALRTLPRATLAEGQSASVAGYYAGTRVGGGVFTWDPASTEADDGGTIIALDDAGTGRFKRPHDGAFLATWFGAVADSGTNDWDRDSGTNNSPMAQAADAAAKLAGASVVLWPPGVYRFTQPFGREVAHHGQYHNGYFAGSTQFNFHNATPQTWLTSRSEDERSFDIRNIEFMGVPRGIHKLFDSNMYRGVLENLIVQYFNVGIDVDGVYVRMKNVSFRDNGIGLYPRPLRGSGAPSTVFRLEDCMFMGNTIGFLYENRGLGGSGSNDDNLLGFHMSNTGFEHNDSGMVITERVWYLTTENCWSEANDGDPGVPGYGVYAPDADWVDINSRWDDAVVRPAGNRSLFRATNGRTVSHGQKHNWNGALLQAPGVAVLNLRNEGGGVVSVIGDDAFPVRASVQPDNSLVLVVDGPYNVISEVNVACTPLQDGGRLACSTSLSNDFGGVNNFGSASHITVHTYDPLTPATLVVPAYGWSIRIGWDSSVYGNEFSHYPGTEQTLLATDPTEWGAAPWVSPERRTVVGRTLTPVAQHAGLEQAVNFPPGTYVLMMDVTLHAGNDNLSFAWKSGPWADTAVDFDPGVRRKYVHEITVTEPITQVSFAQDRATSGFGSYTVHDFGISRLPDSPL